MKDISFFRSDGENKIRLGFRRPLNPPVAGKTKLAQEYLMMLLRTPGLDQFEPELGGGLRAVRASGSEEVLRETVRSLVHKATQDVKKVQIGQGLPSDERLRDVDLVSVKVVNGILKIELRIMTAGGEKAFFNLEV